MSTWIRSNTEDKAKILMVDDHPANLLALEAILEPLGQELVQAASGEDALKALLQDEFAVILMDVQMPGLDGFATARLIKERPRTRHTPIIFITAIHREARHAFRGYATGAVDYLLKPFEPDILRSKISVFVELFLARVKLQRQEALIRTRERELLENKLELRYRMLMDSMPLGLVAARADGSVYFCNKKWSDDTGLTLAQSMNIAELLVTHPEDTERVRMACAKALVERVPAEVEGRIRRASDGMYRWHLGRAVPEFDERGTLVGWIATVTDIHDQKESQATRERLLTAERVARQEAEAANRAKDEFLATVSHELRTPLNAILGWARMLRSGMLEGKKLDHALSTIERNAQVQTDLIDDILDVARIITGKMRVQVKRMSCSAAVKAAVDTVQPAADAKNIHLKVELDSTADELGADPDRFQQIVWNLLSNAIKFTPPAGEVTVGSRKEGERLVVWVKDSGRGISEEFLPYVFDQFRQAESISTRTQGGLGLGLAIVRHLVELHGGTIEARSEGLGKGATFSFGLPLRTIAQDPPEPSWIRLQHPMPPGLAENNVRLDGVRVLFVDDQVDAREMLTELLEMYGAQVVAVETAQGAYEALGTGTFDVLVSDIGLPNENGYDLIRRIRQLPPERGGRIPAVAVTGFARTEDGRRALSEGFQNHLAKPVEPNELIALLGSLTSRHPVEPGLEATGTGPTGPKSDRRTISAA
jgi:PAS domain S-box-containing protein